MPPSLKITNQKAEITRINSELTIFSSTILDLIIQLPNQLNRFWIDEIGQKK